MPEEIAETESSGRSWRGVASAWLVAILLVILFAAGEAVACRHRSHDPSPRRGDFVGAVIPRHDPSVLGPDEVAASDWLERARADAEMGW
jgi:hypothetical protein